jgi:multimeric flavodoxin WrbA
MPDAQLTALALVCTLSPSPTPSSSQLIAEQVLEALSEHGVDGSLIRVVDQDVRPGVQLDMGDGDAWPGIREKLMKADILVLATPTWMGQQSSVAQRVLERLDAQLSEKDDQGRMRTLGQVAIAAVVGNEDGAHHITAVFFQTLNDVGFTIAGQASTYWNDATASDHRDYKDLDQTPEATATTNRTVAAHAAHLARLLRQSPYPPVQ